MLQEVELMRERIKKLKLQGVPVVYGDEYRHGYERALGEMMEFVELLSCESVSDDLQEAAEQYGLSNPFTYMYHKDSDKPISAFIAGADWQKENLMKKAIDGAVERYSADNNDIISTPLTDAELADLGVDILDILKLIVVKIPN